MKTHLRIALTALAFSSVFSSSSLFGMEDSLFSHFVLHMKGLVTPIGVNKEAYRNLSDKKDLTLSPHKLNHLASVSVLTLPYALALKIAPEAQKSPHVYYISDNPSNALLAKFVKKYPSIALIKVKNNQTVTSPEECSVLAFYAPTFNTATIAAAKTAAGYWDNNDQDLFFWRDGKGVEEQVSGRQVSGSRDQAQSRYSGVAAGSGGQAPGVRYQRSGAAPLLGSSGGSGQKQSQGAVGEGVPTAFSSLARRECSGVAECTQKYMSNETNSQQSQGVVGEGVPTAFSSLARRECSGVAECTQKYMSNETNSQQSQGEKGEGYGVVQDLRPILAIYTVLRTLHCRSAAAWVNNRLNEDQFVLEMRRPKLFEVRFALDDLIGSEFYHDWGSLTVSKWIPDQIIMTPYRASNTVSTETLARVTQNYAEALRAPNIKLILNLARVESGQQRCVLTGFHRGAGDLTIATLPSRAKLT